MFGVPLKTRRPIRVLMADDDADDRQMFREALEESFLSPTLHVVENGEQLLNYLNRRGEYADPQSSPRPGLILLDLNMPFINGMKALQQIKQNPELSDIPVVILTTSQSPDDIARAYRLGSNSFITKPVSFTGLVQAIRALGQYWFDVVELPH
jgi:CheY-like chemotaxis protein